MGLCLALRQHQVECLLYLTHPENLQSILANGILSYNRVLEQKIPHESIANVSVQCRRAARRVFGRSIHDYVPLYLARRNPMLWAVGSSLRTYIRLAVEAADELGTAFSDGNAASDETCFFRDPADIEKIPWDVIHARRWTGSSVVDGKRKRCAEVLIPDVVEPRFILDVRCRSVDDVTVTPEYRHILVPDAAFLVP